MSRADSPLVTIITPTYNRAGYLPETIESVLDQGYPNLEYIVLDDGSTDETPTVVERYQGKLIYELHPNMGEACTVNRGWQMARGTYVGVVNSDDPILPGLIQAAVDAFQEDGRLLVVYPDWRMIDRSSNRVKDVRAPDYDYLNMVRWQKCLLGPGALIHRRAFSLESARDPSFRYVGDFEYWLRLGLHGPFARIPATLATHRVHPGSASGMAESARADETMKVVHAYFKRDDLPAAVRKVQRGAFSNAGYNAARMCMATTPGRSREYYRQSLRYDATSYLRWRPQRLAMVAAGFLPETLSGLARRFLERLSNSPMQHYERD